MKDIIYALIMDKINDPSLSTTIEEISEELEQKIQLFRKNIEMKIDLHPLSNSVISDLVYDVEFY